MHLKVCIVILAAAYIAFADEQFLDTFDEDEDVEDFITREKRSSEQDTEFQKEYFFHTRFCCNETKIRVKTEQRKDILAEIKRKCYTKTQNITSIKQFESCYYECIFGIMNETDENGNIVEDTEQLNKLKTLYVLDQETILQNIATKCPVWSKEAAKNAQREYECSPQSMYFWFCSIDMRNLYCPEELNIKNGGCDELRQNLTNTYQ